MKNVSFSNSTEEIYTHIFHELSHASHYFGLGTEARKLWINEYSDIINGWIDMHNRGEDPFDDPYNNGGTDLVKLIESWGYFSENYMMEWKYPNNYYDKLENRRLDETKNKDGNYQKGSKRFFYYGGLYDLIDSGEEMKNGVIVDFCSGYNYNQLFRALISPNVKDLGSFSTALVTVTNKQDDLKNVIKTLEANHD